MGNDRSPGTEKRFKYRVDIEKLRQFKTWSFTIHAKLFCIMSKTFRSLILNFGADFLRSFLEFSEDENGQLVKWINEGHLWTDLTTWNTRKYINFPCLKPWISSPVGIFKRVLLQRSFFGQGMQGWQSFFRFQFSWEFRYPIIPSIKSLHYSNWYFIIFAQF